MYKYFSNEGKQHLIHNYESLEVPFEVGYTAGWDMAYRVSDYIILYGCMLMVFLTSRILPMNPGENVLCLLQHQLGRKKGTTSKLAAEFLFTTAVYWGILLAVNLTVLDCMGFDGANCLIQTDYHYWDSIYHITFFQRSALALADGYLRWMFFFAFVMLFSAASRSVSLVVTVPSLLMLGTNFLNHRGYVKEALKILMLFPHKMTTAYGNEPIRLYPVFSKIVPPITLQRVMYPCIALATPCGVLS